jgi:predicted SprT family Zn-dependent metalloprotease
MALMVPNRLSARARAIRDLAAGLLDAFGLRDWRFAYNRRKREMGLCLFDARIIALSVHFVEMNDDHFIRDTLLHEIAHALVGPGHGHDAVWKSKCREVGARPERLCHEAIMPTGRWQAYCAGCGMLHHRHRKPKRMIGWHCRYCGPVRGRLTWKSAG